MKIWFFLSFLFIFIGTNCYAEEKTISAATDAWPPFIETHAHSGVAIDIVRAAFKTQGYELQIKCTPWARAEAAVANGKYDILIPTWMTSERKKVFLFSEPYLVSRIRFIKRKGDTFEYDDIGSLTGKTVGTVRGYGYDDKFLTADNFKREETDNFLLNIKKLLSHRFDLTLEAELVAKVAISRNIPDALQKIKFVKTPLSVNNIHVASGLKNPRCKEFIHIFNQGLSEIKATGVYQKILSQYGM